MNSIILISASSYRIAKTVQAEIADSTIYTTAPIPGCTRYENLQTCVGECFASSSSIVFIGAMGICVRSIAPYIQDKHTDPAVVCIDSTGRYVVSVLSGHVGGANDMTRQLAEALGAEPVVTTQSDNTGMWALDTLASTYGWTAQKIGRAAMNKVISTFVNGERTALVLETEDEGTVYLEQTCPQHVRIFHSMSEYDYHCRRNPDEPFAALIIVSPMYYQPARKSVPAIPTLQFYPPTLHLGVGCQRMAPTSIAQHLIDELRVSGFAPEAIATVGSIELKKDEPLLAELCRLLPQAELTIYTAEQLNKVKIPNPSERVFAETGCYGVAEAAARIHDKQSFLVIEKQKGKISTDDGRIAHYTYALAQDKSKGLRKGRIEIVGAGPGDPELISLRGKQLLERADLILYAGSLVPRRLTEYHKHGAIVRSSAGMDLGEQCSLMKDYYDKGKLVVRLHTGDPCIYGAIQEQMAFFDEQGMDYRITPGISSFLAAAAELRSQFTIPERCQTIILTRGEGRTAMPEREQLHMLASHQSTMCIFLSASIADKVQDELLQGGYPEDTPVAVCHKLTWKEQRIYRGKLKNLADIVKSNKLTLTTMIVVGEAIDNREGLSRLYDGGFTHLFRTGQKDTDK